ncbi:MAG: hypothetical protein SF182_11645 [Deltaproteobacteria bacterium]|nr:hypothetical protein [Deltaproteobacteria bacterium]
MRRRIARQAAREAAGAERERRALTRRQFLAETALTGVALSLPAFLAACGSDDNGTPRATATPSSTATPSPTPTPTAVPRPREQRTLHFDFSLAEVRNLRLIAAGSASNRAAIVPHTAASRALARQNDANLNAVPDDRLTHYVADVDLPADALQLLMATGTDANGNDALAALYIHVPAVAAAPAAPRIIDLPGIENLAIGVPGFVTIWDTAVSLVFHAPEIMNLDVVQGGSILNMIETLPCSPTDQSCTPFLVTLATSIAELWPATTSGGWATLVQVVDPNGKPVTNNGEPAYRYDLNDGVAQTTTSVAQQIRQVIFDAAQFEGTNWHPTEGLTVVDDAATALPGAAGAGMFSVTAAHPPGTHVHGVKFVTAEVIDPASRTVELQFRNDYIRYLSTYVQFANEAGDLPVQNPTSDDTSRAKFLAWINSNYTVLGIPRFGNDVPLSSVQFQVPADASIAKVYFGSLGTGGEAFCPEALDGSILTLIFNLGLPSMMLVLGVAVSAKMLSALSGEFGVGIVQILKASLPLILGIAGPELANGIFGSANSHSAKEALIELGNSVLSAFFATGQGAAVLAYILASAVVANVVEFAGPLGVIFRLIAVAADVATIAETVVEVLASPALFTNQLTLTMNTMVIINHDPDDFQFPATARNYEVRLTYDSASKVAHKQTGTIEPGRGAPIEVTFDGVPSGGNVTVDIYLTSASGCIVGRSTDASGNIGPYGPVPGTQQEISVTIKELLIPLTQSTQYVHDLKLEYQNGQHVWVSTAAPTATIANLMQGDDDALNDVTGITLSQRTGAVGYSYLAGGQGIPFCGQTSGGIMYMIQNLSLTSDPAPDSVLKQLSCGLQQTISTVYEKLGTPGGTRNFFLQPTEQSFYLKSTNPTDSSPFDLDDPLVWGVFSQALDSLAVVPTGYVIGVDRQNHKMQIIELPATPTNPQSAPQGAPFSVSKMGYGTRPGLLNAPVAVTVFDATILILEDGNQRIQAVDTSGNPVLRFQNGTSNVVALEQGAGIVYLDLGVEGMGYMYVLSFVNDGATAADYRLDVYDPQGNLLTRTTGIAAARLAVDTFRNVYTLNYETIANAPRVQPSLSQWNPHTPGGCPAS